MKTISQEVTISKSQRRDEIASFREQAARLAALEAENADLDRRLMDDDALVNRQAIRIAALEAALRDIEAAWDDDAIPTEDVGGRMVLIARAALAPAPAPEGE